MYYKFTSENGNPLYGAGQWDLPHKADETGEWISGAWREVSGKISPCIHGLHACVDEHLIEWLGPELYILEYDGEVIIDHLMGVPKMVGRKARLVRPVEAWNKDTLWLLIQYLKEKSAYPAQPVSREPYDNMSFSVCLSLFVDQLHYVVSTMYHIGVGPNGRRGFKQSVNNYLLFLLKESK